jgi:hypothetical protein
MRILLTQVVEGMARERDAIDRGNAGTEDADRVIGGGRES